MVITAVRVALQGAAYDYMVGGMHTRAGAAGTLVLLACQFMVMREPRYLELPSVVRWVHLGAVALVAIAAALWLVRPRLIVQRTIALSAGIIADVIVVGWRILGGLRPALGMTAFAVFVTAAVIVKVWPVRNDRSGR